ncbi:CPA2 [Branchiostoma lanceolatum]|uniref:CPA2 protein n=1 Tax=Branchiostoma lanceolatum TaxID=7740 RepID=A0A8J9Z5U4_BRALA|nr:CPA2 [Branchiostoma lanceolatum]
MALLGAVILVLFLNVVLAQTNGHSTSRALEGDQVLRLHPGTPDAVAMLDSLVYMPGFQLDFWKPPSHVNQSVDVHVPRDNLPAVLDLLQQHSIPYHTMIGNVRQAVEKHMQDNHKARARTAGRPARVNDFDFSVYHEWNEIDDFITDVQQTYPQIASLSSEAATFEGRSIKTLKLGKPSTSGETKPAIWIDAAIHCREWISTATVLYAIDQFTRQYGSDPTVTRLLDELDWYFTPVFNIDGYIYTWAAPENRLWRKNRSAQPGPCVGVDLNRNWDDHFAETGASPDPCSIIYHGMAPFSEPETRGISDFVLNHPEIKVYLAMHSYSQLWISPWGYDYARPPHYHLQNAMALAAESASRAVHGVQYRVGRSIEILYAVSGGARDWAYDKAGVTYSYTVELRDTGRYGFLLPADQIIPTAEETFPAYLTVGQWILDHPQ